MSTKVSCDEIISQLYATFSRYPKPERVHGSPLSINEGDDASLLSKPLNLLDSDDFGRYPSRAMSIWGTDEDLKYFLPRILESTLHSFNLFGAPSIFFSTLASISFTDIEQEVIDKYLRLMWDYGSQWPGENIDYVENLIENRDSFSYPMDELIEEWAKRWIGSENEDHFESLVNYINRNWIEIYYNHKPHKAIRDAILGSNLLKRLENAFYKYEKTRPDYAEKLSSCEENLSNYINYFK